MIYGWREKKINIEQTSKYRCPDCGNDSVSFFFFIKYVHLFWIPAFPFGKRIVSHCDNCDAVYENKSIPDSLQNELSFLKQHFKTPPYLFTASVLALLLTVYAVFHYDSKTKFYYPNGKVEAEGKMIHGEMHGK